MGKNQFDLLITPNCCEQVKNTKAVYLQTKYEYDVSPDVKPVWVITHHNSYIDSGACLESRFDYTYPTISFCPFCGTQLPEIEKKPNPVKKIHTVTDGGDYCDSCKDRIRNCTCYPPEHAWRIKKCK